MRPEDVIARLTSRAGVVRVRNVMNHVLWFMTVGTLAFLTAAYEFQADPVLKYVFVFFAAVPSVVFVITHFYFMLKSPDRLQSEEFVVRQHELWIESRSKSGLPQKIEGEGLELPNVIEVDPSEGEQP
ncbi:hypothetical protein IY145_02830 [Methylosinus sp. H3A]|jgi:hypothetical protein|uniref:hypothetical protein n=1 Tax=unclassified Methylosinus TaxID=2624500 RepID=UPI000464F652|nr:MULTISPECIES: hypothetical protein [unclassified Methylosinus]MBG0808309.1 hypothetical protein [Methylosinus sp. H3A]TDX62784.1 hypothetical protein EDE12_109120 [Methylosinus sp. sav-2]